MILFLNYTVPIVYEFRMIKSNYKIVCHTDHYVKFEDLGPWDKFKSITNDIENVIRDLYNDNIIENGTLLEYIDTEKSITGVVHKNGEFLSFMY